MEYFAAQKGTELATDLSERFNQWRDKMGTSGHESRLAKSYRYYYGQQNLGSFTFKESSVNVAGQNGELSVYSTNHYRNLIRNILAITTSQKPAFDCRAVNSDISLLQRARLGNHIVDYYMREKKVFPKARLVGEMSLVMAQSFMVLNWDVSSGREVDTEPVLNPDFEAEEGFELNEGEEAPEGYYLTDDDGEVLEKIVHEGDIKATIHSPLDVMTDSGCENWDEVTWSEVRSYENKWDVAARYPEMRAEVLNSGESESDYNKTKYMGLRNPENNSDFIAIHTFYHLPTAALPSGRLLKRLPDGGVLYDGPYPYGSKNCVFRIAPGEMFGSTEGFTDMYDVLALQDVVNSLDSAMFTNQKAFGVQAVAVAEGSSMSTEDTGNMSFVKVPGPLRENMPQAIQLTATPPEIPNNSKRVEANMEKISGINSVVRGDPDHNLKSGVALQRVQAMAIQYNSNFQHSWANFLEDVGTFILHLLKNFAEGDRVVALSGKHNRGLVKNFTKKDISDIEGVQVDLGNPLSRTLAGRLEIADRLLEKGIVKNPQEYLELMQSGNLDVLTEGETSENDLIRRENEMLMSGDGMDALVGDSHLMHIREHRALLADPYVRANDKLTQVVLAHIQHHMNLHKTQDPFWLLISGEPPALPQQAPAPQGAQPPMPPQGAGPAPMPMGGAPMPDMADPITPTGPIDPTIPPQGQ